MSKHNVDNRANQLNPNNSAYHSSRFGDSYDDEDECSFYGGSYLSTPSNINNLNSNDGRSLDIYEFENCYFKVAVIHGGNIYDINFNEDEDFISFFKINQIKMLRMFRRFREQNNCDDNFFDIKEIKLVEENKVPMPDDDFYEDNIFKIIDKKGYGIIYNPLRAMKW